VGGGVWDVAQGVAVILLSVDTQALCIANDHDGPNGPKQRAQKTTRCRGSLTSGLNLLDLCLDSRFDVVVSVPVVVVVGRRCRRGGHGEELWGLVGSGVGW
jgi:hypothetical protein